MVANDERESMGSLDMGNVSQRVPSIHPFFAIVPPSVASHTQEFAEATVAPEGERGLRRSVLAMATTAVDLLSDPDLLARVREEHADFLRRREERRGGRPPLRRELILE